MDHPTLPAVPIPPPWNRGSWLNPPASAVIDQSDLLVTAAAGSDFWRHTSYGFVHDNGHALLLDVPAEVAVEVSFVVDYDQQFDQAGVMIRHDEQTWIKAGVEFSDGVPNVGAVVTLGRSDWSVAPVPEWYGRVVTIRASIDADAVTIRARCADEPWRLVRVAVWPEGIRADAGPYCCAPTRSGLQIRFTGWEVLGMDTSLHSDS